MSQRSKGWIVGIAVVAMWLAAFTPRVITQQAAVLFGSNSGVPVALSASAAGALSVSIAASSSMTGPFTSILNNLVATPGNASPGTVQALITANQTASTSGVVEQWSAGNGYEAHGWDTDDAVDRVVRCFWILRPVSGATVTSQLQLQCDASPFNGGGYATSVLFTNGGQITATGSVVAGASSSIGFTGRSVTASTANGLFRITQNSAATVGLQINTGTAAPTVTSCGTGSVTAHSTNTAGEVTATGATSCIVTFGAPAWTFQPFCVVTDETTAAALRISAISTTAFTVANLTSGDKFMYHCFGGAI